MEIDSMNTSKQNTSTEIYLVTMGESLGKSLHYLLDQGVGVVRTPLFLLRAVVLSEDISEIDYVQGQ